MRSTPPLGSSVWAKEASRYLEKFLVGDTFRIEEFHAIAKTLRWSVGFAINVLCYTESTGEVEAVFTSDEVWIWRKTDTMKTITVQLFKRDRTREHLKPAELKGFTVDAIDIDTAKRLARKRIERDFGARIVVMSTTVAGGLSATIEDRAS